MPTVERSAFEQNRKPGLSRSQTGQVENELGLTPHGEITGWESMQTSRNASWTVLDFEPKAWCGAASEITDLPILYTKNYDSLLEEVFTKSESVNNALRVIVAALRYDTDFDMLPSLGVKQCDRWIDVLSASFRLAYGTSTRPVESEEIAEQKSNASAPHALTAQYLAETTKLSAEKLGRIVGVTRESFTRWKSGSPIDNGHLTRLHFLESLIREAVARLGVDSLRSWLVTPVGNSFGEKTPVQLLEDGMYDAAHRHLVMSATPQVDNEKLPFDTQIDGPDSDWD